MKKIIFGGFLVLALLFTEMSFASKFKGYPKADQAQEMKLTEKIVKVEELPSEFLVGFTRHAAFYHFPKTEYAKDIKSFLNSRKSANKDVIATIDPVKAQILFIEDAPSAK